MKYIFFILSCLIAVTNTNAKENNRCHTNNNDIKLYSSNVIDFAKEHTVTFGICTNVREGTRLITGYRVHYQDTPKKRLYVDFDVSTRLSFGYSVFKDIIRQVDIGTVLGLSFEGRNIELIFRSKSDDAPAGSDYGVLKSYNLTINNSARGTTAISDPSGSWYQPSLSGTGFIVMQFPNGSVVQYYGYDADGKRLWLISNVIDETWVKGETKTLTLYEGQADDNTNFTTPPAKAPGTVTWGKVDIRFDSCNTGYAKLSGVDGEQTVNLIKLATPNAVHCVDNR